MSIATIPGIPYGPQPRAAAVTSPLAQPPRLVVIHDTGNTASAAAEASYAANRTDARQFWTSAHAYIDASGPLGSLPLNLQAWAAYSYANAHGWHLEMCGMNAGAPGAVPAVTIAHTARLTATLCRLAGIPIVKLSPAQVAAGASGICGHLDITVGLNVGDHDDPGPAFDWPAFMAQVTNGGDDVSEWHDEPGQPLEVARLTQGNTGYAGNQRDTALAFTWQAAAEAKSNTDKILAAVGKPAPIELTDAQLDALAAKLRADMPTPPTAAEIAAAVLDEQARRLAE